MGDTVEQKEANANDRKISRLTSAKKMVWGVRSTWRRTTRKKQEFIKMINENLLFL